MNRKPHDTWETALQVIKILRARGHTALLAGGCVRDRLLKRTPKDYDLVTDATPSRVKQIFPRAREVGAKFGVMLVRKFGHEFEVATFRADGPYSDGRRPDEVTFGSDVEDARRRDFTINGLFLDPIEDRVIDYVDGRADLAAGILRTIGDPEHRFAEDHLRMLRAVRFAGRLEFQIEPATADAIRRNAPEIASISAERVWMELELILTDQSRVRGWSLLVSLHLREHLTSEWPYSPKENPAIEARLAALPGRTIDPSLALAATLVGSTSKRVRAVCRSLRLSNRQSAAVAWLVGSLPVICSEQSPDLADVKLLMAKESWPDLLDLGYAHLMATGGDLGPYDRIKSRSAAIREDQVAPPPLLTGDLLSAMNVSPGPRMGWILDAVYRAQLNEQISTEIEAKAMAGRLINE